MMEGPRSLFADAAKLAAVRGDASTLLLALPICSMDSVPMVGAFVPTWESASNQDRRCTRAVRGDSAQSLRDPTASLDASPIPRLATSHHRIASAVKKTSAPSGGTLRAHPTQELW
jgi:hypothetical protein